MKKFGFAVLAASTALSAYSQARAAETDDTIIVTARRIEESLQDVPISISVFSQEELAKRNVTNAQDLASFTPSLSATTNFGSENSTFAIRGFVQDIGTAPSVGVYFGDVVAPRGPSQGFPAGDGAGPGMFFDLQNVQVLKGPQGTLFGRNTTGGAVILVPQKPKNNFEGYIEGSLGNYNMRRIEGVINVPVTDTIRMRFGVDHQKRDGFMKNVTNIGPRDFDDINYYALRGSVVIDVTPDIENYTIASFIKSDNNGHIVKMVAAGPAHDPFGGLLAYQAIGNIARQDANGFFSVTSDMPDAYQKMQSWQVINNTKWQVNDNFALRNIVSYAQLWTKTHSALFGSQFFVPQGAFAPGIPVATTPFNFAVIRHIPGRYSSNQATFTEEFRIEGNTPGNELTYQAGAYYENATPRGIIGSQSTTFLQCSNPDAFVCSSVIPGASGMNYTAAENAFRTAGLYAQATYELTDQLKLTGGFRYTWDRVKSFSQRITYVFPTFVPNASPLLPIVSLDPLNPLTANVSHCVDQLPLRSAPDCTLTESQNFKAPTWLLGLDYKPTDDILLYAKYTRGYRSGGIKSDVPIEFHIFKPEKVDTFEIGSKVAFRGAVRGSFNISGFYNNFSNQQLQLGFNPNPNRRDANGNPLPAISVPGTAGPVNIGKSRIWGIEADAQLNLFQGFVVNAAYAYLNTRVKSVVSIALPADNAYYVTAAVRAGDPLTLSPKHKLSLGATYTLPLDESIGDISLGANFTYTSSQIGNYSALRDPTIVTDTGGFNTSVLGSRSLVDLNVSWEKIGGGPFDASFFVTNLTNEKYYSSGGGLIGLGADWMTVGAPRMFGARVKVNF